MEIKQFFLNSVAYQQTEDEKDLEYAYFGIFDGHGGREAAAFAKEHLMDHIVRQKGFWSEDDETVLKAIKEGFIQTHHAMWKELRKFLDLNFLIFQPEIKLLALLQLYILVVVVSQFVKLV